MNFMPADHHQPSASSDKGSTYLVSQFDTHIRNIADAYLGFFCERKRIEEAYNNSLLKLHQKAKGIDAYFDSSIKSSTMKAAWVEVRDSLEREAQVRRDFLSALASDIIQPLTALKEAHGRIRERVQADLKESTATHADLAKKVSKFREAYVRKCQELKDDSPNGVIPNSLSNSNISRPFARPQSHDGSASTHLGRPLSRTGSFREFTRYTFHHLVRSNSRNTTRSVFAKEVADQAEKEYRGAIHQLETLRLRKIASLEGASKRLEDVVLEGTETTKHVLLSYADVMVKASSAHFKLATDVRPVIENVSAQRDTSTFVASVHASLAGSIPRPIIYYDYQVGECPDLVFGRTLVDYATSQESEDEVPKILNICINEVDRRGLDVEGIYRVTGRHAKVKELQQRFERSERMFLFNPQRDDIYSIASLLKLYLEELPEPLFRLPLQDRIRHSEQLADENARVSLLRSKIHGLPAIHRVSLGSLMKHLSRVASHATKNNMDSKSLAAIFSPLVLGKDQMPQGDPLILLPNDSVMTSLIENADSLFDECPSPSFSYVHHVPVNDQGSSRIGVASTRSQNTQAAGGSPQLSVRSRSSSGHSSPLSSPSPSSSSGDLSRIHMRQAPPLPGLPDPSAPRILTPTKPEDQAARQQVREADERGPAAVRERGLKQPRPARPSRQLPPVPE